MTFYLPVFPKLKPSRLDSLWFNVDKPRDEESELSKLEKEYQQWLTNITQKDVDLAPIGKAAHEHLDEDDDDDDDNDEDSESNDIDDDDDDLDVEINDNESQVTL